MKQFLLKQFLLQSSKESNEVKERIIEILDRTFKVIDQCYHNNDESSSTADFSKAGTRLIFPCYSRQFRNGERRISEQELRFVFIEQFIQYCQETDWDAYYSVETPTEWKYKFSGEDRPHKTEDGTGQSAMIDVCIHNNRGERICLIEFKAGNPAEFSYEKDLVKLSAEGGLCFLVQLLESQRSNTMKSILSKVTPYLDGTTLVCHTIDSQYQGTKYISNEIFKKNGWEAIYLEE